MFVDIRPAKEEELEELVDVMCISFRTPPEERKMRRRQIEAIPGMGVDNARVVTLDGKIISALIIIPAEILINGFKVKMGGLGGVCTLPDYRRRGYAGELLRYTVREMRRLGFITSALYPFSFAYYRKFGWELASNVCLYKIDPSNLPPFREKEKVKEYSPEDLPAIKKIYGENIRAKNCCFVRSDLYWKKVTVPRAKRFLVYKEGEPEGYLIGEIRQEEDGKRALRIGELFASTDRARRGLVGYLTDLDEEVGEIKAAFPISDLTLNYLLPSLAHRIDGYEPRGQVKIIPNFMFRVVDIAGCLKTSYKLWCELDKEISFIIHDDVDEENEGIFTIGIEEDEVIKDQHKRELWLEADIRVFSQIYCGYVNPTEAYSLGRIEVSSGEALSLADKIFPSVTPYICWLDSF